MKKTFNKFLISFLLVSTPFCFLNLKNKSEQTVFLHQKQSDEEYKNKIQFVYSEEKSKLSESTLVYQINNDQTSLSTNLKFKLFLNNEEVLVYDNILTHSLSKEDTKEFITFRILKWARSMSFFIYDEDNKTFGSVNLERKIDISSKLINDENYQITIDNNLKWTNDLDLITYQVIVNDVIVDDANQYLTINKKAFEENLVILDLTVLKWANELRIIFYNEDNYIAEIANWRSNGNKLNGDSIAVITSCSLILIILLSVQLYASKRAIRKRRR